MYESTTIASRIEMAIEIGKTKCADAALTPTRTTSADSVAYATEESGSDAKIGSARVFGRRVSSIWPVRIGRPTTWRRARRGASTGSVTAPALRARAAARAGASRVRGAT